MITKMILKRVQTYDSNHDSGERRITETSDLYRTNISILIDFSHDEFDDYAKIYDIIRQTDCK